MLEEIGGVLTILASGLLGRDALIKRQPSLHTLISHVDIYRDAIGFMVSLSGVLGAIHSISTVAQHVYSPLYWIMWTWANLIGAAIGLTLIFDLYATGLSKRSPLLYRICLATTSRVIRAPDQIALMGITFGAWRVLDL